MLVGCACAYWGVTTSGVTTSGATTSGVTESGTTTSGATTSTTTFVGRHVTTSRPELLEDAIISRERAISLKERESTRRSANHRMTCPRRCSRRKSELIGPLSEGRQLGSAGLAQAYRTAYGGLILIFRLRVCRPFI